MNNEFFEALRRRSEAANELCIRLLPKAAGRQATLLEAMHYSVEAGGKRLRPILMREAFELLHGQAACASAGESEAASGLRRSTLEAMMAAMEWIHTFSLCHDDLPCMDDDRFRRGKPSTWAEYGEDIAVLCGDALLFAAYRVLSDARARVLESEGLAEQEKLHILGDMQRAEQILHQKAGTDGMLGGQTVDVELTGGRLDAETLQFIYELKTAALLEASLMMGAALAGASGDYISTLERAGRSLGMAFQIQDDLLDELGTQEKLGKPIHSDLDNQKTTYVSLFGQDISKSEVERLTEAAVREIQSLPTAQDTEFLTALCRYLISREN